MKEFQTAKNGYSKDEVREYITHLEEKLEFKEQEVLALSKDLEKYIKEEKQLKEKQSNISIALTAAVEKAKQIEKSSGNVYKLKIEELQILYARWERVLNEIVDKYPNLDEVDNVKRLMQQFSNAIKSDLKEDFRFVNQSRISKPDPMRELLKKMGSNMDRQLDNLAEIRSIKRPRKPIMPDIKNKQSELNRLEEKSSMIKPIFDTRIRDNSSNFSPVDKFLTEEADVTNAYASKIASKVSVMPEANESGFDLKEAVNPKEDLEEIMKSFDFFNNAQN